MSIALHLRLRDEPDAAAVARRAIAATLAGTAFVDLDVVTLVVTELIARLSNAAGDEDPSLDVNVDVNASRVRVHVTGPARRERPAPEPAPEATLSAGWSLLLMERTVDRWGIDDGPVTRVWFEIDLPDAVQRTPAVPGAGSR
jgi:histidine kinase-like protein